MVGDNTESALSEYSRRNVLKATGVAVSVGIAGCSSNGSDSSPNGNAGSSSDDSNQDGTNSGNADMADTESNSETTNNSSTPTTEQIEPYKEDIGGFPRWVANPTRDGYTAEYNGPGTDGEVLWQHPDQFNFGNSGSLLVIDGTSYIVNSNNVAAIGPSGNEQWSKNLSMDMDPKPFIFDDTLVLTTSSRVIGLNPTDGSRRWLQSLEAGYSEMTPVGKYNDRILYVANAPDDSGLRVLWYHPFEQEIIRESDTIEKARAGGPRPILGDQRLYLSGANMGISLSDGSVSWDAEDRAHEQAYLYSNGKLLLSRWEGGNVITDIRALDGETGETQWETSGLGANTTRSMAADDMNVYTVGETKITAYGLNNGEKSWEQITASQIQTTCAIGGSNLYFATGDGKLHVLDTETGERKGRYGVNNVSGSITVVGNRIYFNRTGYTLTGKQVGQIIVIGSTSSQSE
jgi:hypothetical protein